MAAWRARLLLGLLGVIVALATAEMALRIARFHFDLIPTLEFGWPDAVALRDAYEADPDLIWVTKDYRVTLRAARRQHPAVVFMGDSCTEFGSYPAQTLDRLAAAHSPLANGVKLAVGGWSTEQGVAQLERDVIPLHPKVVTVYYGWNDHWVAMGLTDPEISSAHRLLALARASRLAQLWLRLQVNFAARRSPRPNRVPLSRYEDNLRRIAKDAHKAGIIPVFVTAPTSHQVGQEPAYLAKRHARSLSEVVPLHASYVEATRRVARETSSTLCDAAAAFAALPEPRTRYFQRDGIHFSAEGDAELGRVLGECLRGIH